jgi:hypothetical protein
MPYGFYRFVRFVAIDWIWNTCISISRFRNKSFLIIYGTLAILFQPFFKIALGRELWNIVDVIVGIGLIISLFIDKQQKKD